MINYIRHNTVMIFFFLGGGGGGGRGEGGTWRS